MSHVHPQDSVSLNGGAGADRAQDLAAACEGLARDPRRAVVVVDVDEVLALFVQGFARYLRTRGHELRLKRFALFSSIYPEGGAEPADRAAAQVLFDAFFAQGCGELDAAPGGAEALARLARRAQVVILTAAPEPARASRSGWLKAQSLDYPLVFSPGLKGGHVRALAEAAGGPAAFVDDLLPNLDSVAEAAPQVKRYQLVADPALRELAPTDPARHRRVDDWPELALAIEADLFPPG